jgi:hypothetical protein
MRDAGLEVIGKKADRAWLSYSINHFDVAPEAKPISGVG